MKWIVQTQGLFEILDIFINKNLSNCNYKGKNKKLVTQATVPKLGEQLET